MSTRKANGSKITSATSVGKVLPKAKGRKARAVSSTASDLFGAGRVDVAKLAAPGAAVLASGAVAAIAYVFKEQIGDVVVDALKAAVTRSTKLSAAAGKGLETTREGAMDIAEQIADQVSMKALLRHAGLQRRSMLGSVLGPAVGVVLGMVAGSALTYFFGPKLLDQFQNKDVAANDTEKHDDEASTSVASDLDRPRANGGGMHGGIS